jgi:hypothetical protein
MRLPCMIALFGVFALAACASPSPMPNTRNADLCGDDLVPHPGTLIIGFAGVKVGSTTTLTACFTGDREDLAAVAAIQWTSLSPEIATVAPLTGRQTEARGVSFGVARVRALVKGSPLETQVRVCLADGTCPPL